MSEDALPEFLDPLLDYLSSVLPPPLYSVVTTAFYYAFTLIESLIDLAVTLIKTSPSSWEADKILPPIITLLAAYLALLSFYRTTGWMIRTTFAFVKWGFILTTLGAAAGYFIANADVGGANGLGQFGSGILGSLGSMLLSMLSGDTQNTDASRRTRAQSSRQRQESRPKSWESWDRHREWQYSENARQEDEGQGTNVQEVIGKILGSAGNAVRESGWWEAAKGAVNEFSKNTQGEDRADTEREAGRGTKSSGRTSGRKQESR